MARNKKCHRCGIVHDPCPECGKIVHDRDWPFCPHESTIAVRSAIAAVVIHIDKKGNVRFPASSDAPVPKHFQRVELKTIQEISAFEHRMNRKLSSEAERHVENEERFFKPLNDKSRSELRDAMRTMSEQGRDFAQFCINKNNDRRRKSTHIGFHLPILHFDSHNREPYRDERTGWRRKEV